MSRDRPSVPIDWMLSLAIAYAIVAWTMVCFALGLLIGNGGPDWSLY